MMGDETDKRTLTAMEALKEVIKHFNDLKDPNGSKDAPARSCRDLANSHPEFKSGYYHIDPNKGNVKDTIMVYCKMETGETCITPSPSDYHKKDLTKDKKKAGESYLWLSHQLTKYKQFPYKSDGYQIKALQSISSYASQNVTFHCMNTIAYHDQMVNSKYKAVKLMSYNEENLTAEGKRAFRYAVNLDGCKTKSDKWDKTVIEMATTNSKLLPLLDVGVYDVGNGKQDFHIELGDVCFS